MVFPECAQCVATPFCRIYSGEVEPRSTSFCSSGYRLRKALALSEIPSKYLQANFYTAHVDEENKEIYTKMKPVIKQIVEVVEEGRNFYFYSAQTGTGKTFLASCVLNHYIYKTCNTHKFDFENPLALFITHSDLMDDLRYRRDEEEVQQRLSKAREVPLLLLDDVGSGTVSDFVREQTNLLLNYRVNHAKSTIFTSNYDMKELKHLLHGRIVSRIIDQCMGAEIKGRDRRMDRVDRGAGK